MKKVFVGLIALFFAGQISFAQPVSDMAVIPMGITIQSIMRLDITKGGNIEFVFSRINQLTAGIVFSTSYETTGTISASQNWDLTLTADGAFSDGTNSIPLDRVQYQFIAPLPPGATAAPVTVLTAADLASPILLFDGGTLGASIPFTIQWQCGVAPNTIAAGTSAGRYTSNIILSLTAD